VKWFPGVYRRALNVLHLPLFLSGFLSAEAGRDYGVGVAQKLRLLTRFGRNVRRIQSETSWWEHVLLAERILRIPAAVPGVVVECGCFKGASTASLSLVCSLTGRRLIVFDSFQGLPQPAEADSIHHVPHLGESHAYRKGDFRAGVQEVEGNIEAYGALQACELIPGYFEDTLPAFGERCVFAFLDVDLRDSLETCLTYLWPLLQDGCELYSHEAHHLEIAQVFFDDRWWRRLGFSAPGLIGAGSGLSYNASRWSAIGYTIKGAASLQSRVRTWE
jgi:hypothetical protein